MSEEADQRPEPSVLRSLRGIPGTILNQQKGRVCFVANPADESSECGMKYRLELGWHKVDHRKMPERIHGGSTNANGDVTWKGQVLLWISEADHNAIYGEHEEAVAELFGRAHGPGGVNHVVDDTGKLASEMETKGEA